jgi:hypothetical protein
MSELYHVTIDSLVNVDHLVDDPLFESAYTFFVQDAGAVVRAMKVKTKRVANPLKLIEAGIVELRAKPPRSASALPPKKKTQKGTFPWVRDMVLHAAAPEKFPAPEQPVLVEMSIRCVHPDAGMYDDGAMGGLMERWALRIAALAPPEDNALARALGGIDGIVSNKLPYAEHVWEIEQLERKKVKRPAPDLADNYFSCRLRVLYSKLAAAHLVKGSAWSTTAF